MKPAHWWTILVAAFSIGSFGYFGGFHVQRIGPASAYPNPQLSPGLVATTDAAELQADYNGLTYSRAHRNTPQSVKNKVKQEYGCTGKTEIDHIIPLAIGGADDIKNLWCEPAHLYDDHGNDWGYPVKDVLEGILATMVKSNSITPAAAQSCISSDWIRCYQKYVKFGAISSAPDGDDETVQN